MNGDEDQLFAEIGTEIKYLSCLDVGPLEQKQICKIARDRDSVFEPVFKITLTPLSISKQKEIAQQELLRVEEKLEGKTEEWESLPFSITSLKSIQDKMRKKKIKNFVDPEFPPWEKSLFDSYKSKKYPFEYVWVCLVKYQKLWLF